VHLVVHSDLVVLLVRLRICGIVPGLVWRLLAVGCLFLPSLLEDPQHPHRLPRLVSLDDLLDLVGNVFDRHIGIVGLPDAWLGKNFQCSLPIP